MSEAIYTEEQAQMMRKEFNHFIDKTHRSSEHLVSRSLFDTFLKDRFNPKIDYVGKVWKDEKTSKIFECTSVGEYGQLFGYGLQGGDWFNYQDHKGFHCATNFPEYLTKATQEEWEEALVKEAEKRGLVEGVEYRCVEVSSKQRVSKRVYWRKDHNCLYSDGCTLMKDGKWAEPIKEEKPKVNLLSLDDLFEEFDNIFSRSDEKSKHNPKDLTKDIK